MNHRMLLATLLALLATGGGVAWLILGDGDEAPRPFAPEIACDAPARVDRIPADKDETTNPLPLDDAETAQSAPPQSTIDEDARPGATDTGTTRESPPGRDGHENSARSGGGGESPTRASGSNSGPGEESKPKRRLTRAEQEEIRRKERGRPALRRRLRRTPGAAGQASASLQKSAKQEEWEEQWYQEGFTPPEMTPTPVKGKIMSEQAREGLGEATVGLISFFPLNGVPGGKLLPVITELETNEKGFFEGEIPASELAPLNYPRVALSISWEGHRVVTAIPVDTIVAGQQNELGIFWAPELPFELDVDATQFDGDLKVVSTGELDPQRWHEAKRAQIFVYFPQAKITQDEPEGPPQLKGKLVSTWNGMDAPYISLLDGAALVQTRRPTRAGTVSSNGGAPQPFSELVFEANSFTPISGQVVDDRGAAIAGAVITTVGDPLTRTVIADAAGWFYIEDPPEQTHSLHCTHDNWVETRLAPVQPGDSNVTITLTTPRPRIGLFITDKLTQAPLSDIGVRVTGRYPWGDQAGQEMPVESVELTSTDGHFLLEWEYEIASITLEKIGYFPRTVADPANAEDEGEGFLRVELSPGRELDVRPRNYTGVEREVRWFPDSGNGPGIYTAWAHHWIEYDVDFGDAPEEGEEGGSFDMLLGCTNHGIVDNEYQFKVDVYLDGEKKGTLSMIADSLHEQIDRMPLGELSGVHTVRLVWTNDKWIPDQLDANIRFQSLKFIEQP